MFIIGFLCALAGLSSCYCVPQHLKQKQKMRNPAFSGIESCYDSQFSTPNELAVAAQLAKNVDGHLRRAGVEDLRSQAFLEPAKGLRPG